LTPRINPGALGFGMQGFPVDSTDQSGGLYHQEILGQSILDWMIEESLKIEAAEHSIATIYDCISSGTQWRFLQLSRTTATIRPHRLSPASCGKYLRIFGVDGSTRLGGFSIFTHFYLNTFLSRRSLLYHLPAAAVSASPGELSEKVPWEGTFASSVP
jgi:hypothetical protein